MYGQFLISALCIIFSAQWLARICDRLAISTKMGHFFVGSLLLAIATSAPEFFVDVRASVQGLANLAAGDLLGSSLCNLMIICILITLFRQIKNLEIDRVTIKHCVIAALLTEAVTLFIHFRPTLHVGWLFPGTILLLVGYIAGLLYTEQEATSTGSDTTLHFRDAKIAIDIVKFCAAMGAIFFASQYIVEAAEHISRETGLGDTFVGATLLAITTSLPELVASISAIRMNALNMALGNIIGSNAFNMIIFLPMDIAWKDGSIWPHISEAFVFPGMLITSNMLLLCLLWNKGATLQQRRMGVGAIFGLSVCGFAALYFAA